MCGVEWVLNSAEETKLAGLWGSRCEAINLRGQDAPAVHG